MNKHYLVGRYAVKAICLHWPPSVRQEFSPTSWDWKVAESSWYQNPTSPCLKPWVSFSFFHSIAGGKTFWQMNPSVNSNNNRKRLYKHLAINVISVILPWMFTSWIIWILVQT